ncbi:MAG: hypothetical protein WDO17_15480 [Alphaproteobacteria bacterium]
MTDPTPLSFSQVSQLSSVLNNTSLTESQRVLSYYQTLGSYGYDYGALASGIASGSSIEGQLSDAFLKYYAEIHSVPINDEILSNIRFDLAAADLAARASAGGADISGQAIANYHSAVLTTYGFSGAGWIFNTPYQLLGETGWAASLQLGASGEALVGGTMAGLAGLISFPGTIPAPSMGTLFPSAQQWFVDLGGALSVLAQEGLAVPGNDIDLGHFAIGQDLNGSFHFSFDPSFDSQGTGQWFQISPSGTLSKSIITNADRTITSEFGSGQLISNSVDYAAGGSADTVYSNDPNSLWSFNTTIHGDHGELVGTVVMNRDGSFSLASIDPVTGEPLLTTDVASNGKATQTAAAGITYPAFVQAIADTLATQLISKFLTDKGVPATIVAQAFADATIQSALNPPNTVDFSSSFASSIFAIGAGRAGSELGALIADKLGLPSDLGSLAGGVTGNLLGQALAKEVLTTLGVAHTAEDVLSSTNFENAFASAGGAYFGSLLADAFVAPTETGQIIGSLATAAAIAALPEGSAAIAALVGLQPEFAPLVIFAVAFGSDFLGNLIGSLFGNSHPSVGPNAGALVGWNNATHKFVELSSAADNGANTDIVDTMGAAVASVMNDALQATGGSIGAPVTQMRLGWMQQTAMYSFGIGTADGQQFPSNFSDPNAAIQNAAIRWMSTLTITGGDPYVVYAVKHSAATSLTDFYADLSAARAYSLYKADPVAFDTALAAANDPSLLATWQQEQVRAHALGLDALSTAELQGLTLYGSITPDSLAMGLPILGHATNFLGGNSQDYFVDHPANGLEVYKFDNHAGILTNAIVIRNPDGTKFSLPSGSKIIGTGSNLTGSGESDILAADGSGHVLVYKVDAQAHVTAGPGLTYTDGTAFGFSQPSVPAYNSDAYWQMWQSTLRQLGYTGLFDGVTPLSWFQSQYGVALDSTSAAGMEQLLSHLHPLPLPANAQIVGTANNLLGHGGFNILSEDANSHLFVYEFNSLGQAVAEKTLSYSGPSPFANAQVTIPEWNTDPYWQLWQSTLRAIGYTGPFDGKTPVSWFVDTYGVPLDPQSSAGMRQLLDKLALQNPQIVGAFGDLTGTGGYNLAIEDKTGRIGLHTFDAQGAALAQTWLTKADGTNLAWQEGSALVGKGSNLLGAGGIDIFVRQPDGSVRVVELNPATPGQASTELLLTNADSSPFTVGQSVTMTNLGSDLFRKGGQDLVVVALDGRVSVEEFDTTGKLLAAAPLYNADGGGLYLPANTTFLGTAESFYGLQGHDLVLRDSSGQVSVTEFDPYGKAYGSSPLYLPDGGHFYLPAGATLLGAGHDFAGQSGQDLFFRYADGTLNFLEFSTSDRVRAVTVSPLYLPDGGHFYLPQNASLLGVTENFAGLNGKDLLFRYADGTVHMLEFSQTDRPRAVASTALTNPNGSPFFVPAGSTVIPASYNQFGQNGFDLMLVDSARQVSMVEFDPTGKAYIGANSPLYVPDGGHFYLPVGSTFLQATYNFYGTADHDLLFRNADGSVQVMGFDPVDRVRATGNEALTNSSGNPFTLANNATVVATAQNVLGTGHDLVIQAADGSVTVDEFNSAGRLIASQPLGDSGGLDPQKTVIVQSGAAIALNAGENPVAVIGNSDTISVGNGVHATLLGSHNTLNLGTNDTLEFYRGTDNTVNGSGAAIELGSLVGVTINGAGNSVTAADGDAVTVSGNGQWDSTETITMSNGTVNLANNASTALHGSGNTVSAGNSDYTHVLGNNNALSFGSNGAAWIETGTGNTLQINGGTEWLGGTTANTTVNGGWNWVNADGGASLAVNGAANHVTMSGPGTVTVSGNGQWDSTETVSMSGGTVNLADNASTTLSGSGNTVSAGSTDYVHVQGNNNALSLGGNGAAWVESGNGNVVHMNGGTMWLGGATLNTSVLGDWSWINADNGASFNVSGSYDGIIGSHLTIYLNPNTTNISITGNNNTLHVRPGDTYSVSGTGTTIITDNVITAHNGDTLQSFNGLRDIVDLSWLPFDSSITATPALNAGHTAGQLVVVDHGVTVATINLTAIQNIGSFTVRSDNAGGTLLVDPPLSGDAVPSNLPGQGDAHARAAMFGDLHADQFVFNEATFREAAQNVTKDMPAFDMDFANALRESASTAVETPFASDQHDVPHVPSDLLHQLLQGGQWHL